MQAFPVIRSSDLSSLPGPALFIPRTQLTLTKKLFFCSAKFGVARANLLVAEKEETKAVLTLFLKKRGLSKGESLQLLRSRMLCVHTLKASMRSSDILGDAMENFPNPPFEGRSIENLSVSPVKEALVVPVSSPFTTPNSKKLGALARLTDNSPTGELPPLIICLTELGIDYELIKEVTSKFPTFANYCLDGKVKLVVEFLLDLGVPKSDFPAILRKSPQVFGASLSERVIPNLMFLEKLGVDRKHWPKVIYRHPPLLTYSLQKMKSNLDCLYELGLSKEKLGKVLMYSPNILGTGVEKLRATAQYFHSIGANVGTLLHKSPQLFGLSVEANLKPVTLFFLEKGFSMEEVAFMVSRYGCLYCFSLSKNIMPKWEFFLTMGYPKSDLVKFPHYFGYSLELRIKPRTQFTFPKRLFFCSAKFAELGDDELANLGGGPANLLVAEKEAAKAVLTLFLKKRGFSKAVAARTISKSALFIHHLVSRLRSVNKIRHLGGRELTTLEIRDALYPYLETLYEEFGDIVVDVMENFPNPPIQERSTENLSIQSVEGLVVPVSAPISTLNSNQLRALASLTDDSPTGKPPPDIIYLTELGMEVEVIKEVTRKFPTFAYYISNGKVKPVVEFLLDLGVPKSDIPDILRRFPSFFGVSLSEHSIPNVSFLENLGVDKKQWPKVIYEYPMLLAFRRQKLKSNLDCLYELGLSTEKQGKVIMRCPKILGYGVEKLRARGEYFKSMGVDVGTLLHKCPQIFGLSIEANLKLVTQFFLERGFSIKEVAAMVSSYGNLYALSLANNILPKWEFFLTMGYPKSDLVKYPQYFGFSLERRIKPRYAILMESGVRISLNMLLSRSDGDLDGVLERKMEKHAG